MCLVARWFWPLLLTLLVGLAVAHFRLLPEAERRLASRMQALLAASDPWARVSLDGRDARLEGVAPGEAERDAALARLRSSPEIRRVVDATAVLPRRDPFVFEATRMRSSVRLSGAVPPGLEAVLVERALRALPRRDAGGAPIGVTEAIEEAGGAPEGFAALAGRALDLLDRLDEGRVRVENTRIEVAGRARDGEAYAALKREEGIDASQVIPPLAAPYTLTAERRGEGVLISGHAPSEALRADLLAEAGGAAAGGAAPAGGLALASGAPERFEEVAKLLPTLVGQLASGRVALADRRVEIAGEPRDVAAERAIEAALALAGEAGYTVVTQNLAPARRPLQGLHAEGAAPAPAGAAGEGGVAARPFALASASVGAGTAGGGEASPALAPALTAAPAVLSEGSGGTQANPMRVGAALAAGAESPAGRALAPRPLPIAARSAVVSASTAPRLALQGETPAASPAQPAALPVVAAGASADAAALPLPEPASAALTRLALRPLPLGPASVSSPAAPGERSPLQASSASTPDGLAPLLLPLERGAATAAGALSADATVPVVAALGAVPTRMTAGAALALALNPSAGAAAEAGALVRLPEPLGSDEAAPPRPVADATAPDAAPASAVAAAQLALRALPIGLDAGGGTAAPAFADARTGAVALALDIAKGAGGEAPDFGGALDAPAPTPPASVPLVAAARGTAAPGGTDEATPGTLQPTPGPLPGLGASCDTARPVAAPVIYFERAKAVLMPEAGAALDAFAASLEACPQARVRIVGWADAHGPVAYNRRLSALRAEAAARRLAAKGIALERIETEGGGPREPTVDPREARRAEVTLRAADSPAIAAPAGEPRP